MQQQDSLVEILASMSGCTYISDLHFKDKYRSIAAALASINAEDYSLYEWNDAARYIAGTDRKFEIPEDAQKFLLAYCLK